ncbi:hypothetical protein, partial [Pediococcus damnosus]|uniref:hypothetical protein n=1 Tax=Pediococcus damnosus TaxID=51663 RepID=UPI0019D3E273
FTPEAKTPPNWGSRCLSIVRMNVAITTFVLNIISFKTRISLEAMGSVVSFFLTIYRLDKG